MAATQRVWKHPGNMLALESMTLDLLTSDPDYASAEIVFARLPFINFEPDAKGLVAAVNGLLRYCHKGKEYGDNKNGAFAANIKVGNLCLNGQQMCDARISPYTCPAKKGKMGSSLALEWTQ